MISSRHRTDPGRLRFQLSTHSPTKQAELYLRGLADRPAASALGRGRRRSEPRGGQGPRLLGADLAPLQARPRRDRQHRLPHPARARRLPGRLARRAAARPRPRRPSSRTAIDEGFLPVGPMSRVTNFETGESQLLILGADGSLGRDLVPAPALRRPRLAPGRRLLDHLRDDDRRHARCRSRATSAAGSTRSSRA